jgi:hypothetical protein
MSLPAARLGVRLDRAEAGLQATLASPQAVPIAAVLLGQDRETAATLVGRVFGVCAAAQEAAARSALGLPVDARMIARVRAETLREHVMKLCLVWPPLAGLAPAAEIAALCRTAATDADARVRLRAGLFGGGAALPSDWDGFVAWMRAADTVPARTCAALRRDWDAAWGRTDGRSLDAAADPDWPTATQFGSGVDNGVAPRQALSPLVAAVAEMVGTGPLWRIAARLAEVDRLLSDDAFDPVRRPGVVEAARGTLYVRAGHEGGAVTAFERLSPTDFAVYDHGTLQTALETLPPDAADLDGKVGLVIETIDPCVPTDVEWGGEWGHA